MQNVTTLWEEMKQRAKVEFDKDVTEMHPDYLHDNTIIHLHIISAMQPASFPITHMRDCHLRTLGLSDGSDVSVQTLCKLLGVCDEQGRVHVHRETEYGEVYVHLEPVQEDKLPKFEHDLHFEVVGTDHNNEIVSKG